MNNIGTYLVDELIKEIENITDYVVVYSGRFQPFHKGHFSTYQNLVKKFGKGNVYIGTSDKTDKLKSPFNFKEKQTIMTKMFGIPSNRIVEIKNPYVPTEILKKFDKDTTAFVTVVGEKDEQRLGGKYFTPYKGVFDAGYGDKGYVYISPSQPNAISGTDVRNWLGKGEIEDRKKLFSKAYPKFDEKIFNLIVKRLDSLNESIFIPKEIIEYWATHKLNDFLKEVSLSNAGGVDVAKDVDDGPNFFFPNYDTFDIVSKGRAAQIGYTVFKQIMSGDLEDYYEHPIYPNGPVKAVTPFPAGVIGATTATNQKDFGGIEAYDKWYRHVTRTMGLAGYQLVKGMGAIAKELSIKSADNTNKVAGIETIKDTVIESGMSLAMGYPSKEQLAKNKKERDMLRKTMDKNSEYYEPINEDITIPVKIGDTILTGKFKNKKVVVTSIGKDERGMPTVNGKKVVNFRLMSEGIYIEMVGDAVVCSNCKHSWKIDDGDENPYLCHKCGWDTKTNTFDYKELNKWKKSVKSVDDIYNESVEELIAEFRAEGILNEIPIGDLQQIDKFADTQLNPFNIVLTGKHFMDRLVDTRNKKPISAAELIGFFKRLSRKKTEFAEFLKKYGEIVAKDNRTKINIPFMKQANNAIAKTIMRKDNFKTPSPELKFEATSRGKMYEPKRIKAYYEALCKSEGVKSLPIKFGSVGKGGAALTFNPKTMKPLYISFDVNRLSDPEFAIIHELTHQIKLETEGDAYVGKRDQLAKFKKLENYLIDKYVYSNYSKLLYEMNFETINEDTIKYISKSLGVSRSKMPQINSKDITDFVKYLKDKGVSVSPSVIDVSKVGMTQKDINVDKVKDLLGVEKSNLAKPVIISKDNYILDGHHRVVALYNIDKNFKLKTIKVDLGIKDLLSVSNQFPKVSFKGITESNITGLSGGNNSARWTKPGEHRKLNIPSLAGYEQVNFPTADSMDISNEKDKWMGGSGNKYQNKVRARRDDDGNLIIENIESNLEKKYGVEVDIYEYTDYIELSKVVVPKESRGSGIGTKFMNDLINYAKAKNKDIFLTPSSDFGGSKGRLIQFYKGFGFKNNKGKYRDFRSKNSMVLHIDVE